MCVHFERKFAVFFSLSLGIFLHLFSTFSTTLYHECHLLKNELQIHLSGQNGCCCCFSLSWLLIFLFFFKSILCFRLVSVHFFVTISQSNLHCRKWKMFARTTEHAVAKWIVRAIWCDFFFLRNFSSNFLFRWIPRQCGNFDSRDGGMGRWWRYGGVGLRFKLQKFGAAAAAAVAVRLHHVRPKWWLVLVVWVWKCIMYVMPSQWDSLSRL